LFYKNCIVFLSMCIGESDLLGYTKLLSSSLEEYKLEMIMYMNQLLICKLQLIFITLAKHVLVKKKCPKHKLLYLYKIQKYIHFSMSCWELRFFSFLSLPSFNIIFSWKKNKYWSFIMVQWNDNYLNMFILLEKQKDPQLKFLLQLLEMCHDNVL
jgi:hypothetical protein